MAEGIAKKLTIIVELTGTAQAQQEAKELWKTLSGTGGGGGMSDQIKQQEKQMSSLRRQAEQMAQFKEKTFRDQYDREQKLILQRETELKRASSYKTTPYLFGDISKQVDEYRKGAAEIILINKKMETELIRSRSIKTTPYAFVDIREQMKMYREMSTMISQVGAKDMQSLIAGMRAGITTKTSLGQSISIDTQGLQRLLKQMDDLKIKAPETYNALNSAFQKMGVNIEAHHNRLNKFAASVSNYARFQIQFYTGMAAIFAVTAGITSTIRAILEFEQTLKNIQAVIGATDKEMKLLGESSLNIAAITGYSATEIAKLGLQLIRAGIEMKDLTATMEAAAKVAKVSGEDLKTVTDTFAIIKSAWHLTGKDMAEVANILVNALNYSRLTIEDFGTALNYLAGTSAMLGKSFLEVASIMSVLSNMGVRASTIGTGLSQMFAELISPSQAFRKELDRIHVSLEDVNIRTHSYAQVLTLLVEKGFNVGKAMEYMNDRTGRSFMFAVQAGASYFETMQIRLSETNKLMKAFDIVMEGTLENLKRLATALQIVAIRFANSLLPAITPVIKGIRFFVMEIGSAIEELKRLDGILITLGIFTLFRYGKVAGTGAIGGKDFGAALLLMFPLLESLRGLFNKLTIEIIAAGRAIKMAFALGAAQGFLGIIRTIAILFSKTGWIGMVLTLGGVLWGLSKALRGNREEMEKQADTLDNITGAYKRFESQLIDVEEALRRVSVRLDKMQFNVPAMSPDLLKSLNEYNKFYNQLYGPKISAKGQMQFAVPTDEELMRLQRLKGNIAKAFSDALQAVKTGEEKILEPRELGIQYEIEIKTAKDGSNLGDFIEKAWDDAIKRMRIGEKKLGKVDKKEQSVLLDYLRNQHDIYKDHFQALQKLHDEELAELQQVNELKEEQDRAANERLKVDLSDRTWLLDTFYREELTNAQTFYEQKKQILEQSLQGELTLIRNETQRQLNEFTEQYENAEKQWFDLATEHLKVFDLIGKTTNKEALQYLNDRLRNLDIQMQSINITSTKLETQMETVREQGINKLAEAIRNADSNLLKLIYDMQIASALQPFKQKEWLLQQQETYNKYLQEASELTGNWNEVEKIKLELIKNETALTDTNYQAQIAMNKVKAAFIDDILLKSIPMISLEYIYWSDLSQALKDQIPIIEQNADAWKKLQDIKVYRQEKMLTKGGAFDLALEDMSEQYKLTNQKIYDATVSLTQGMESAFNNFFDTQSDRFMDFGKLAIDVLNQIYKALVNLFIIQPLISGITGALSGIGGTARVGGFGSAAHEGGLVMHGGGMIPVFHGGGLLNDERIIKAQTGEGFISRRGMKTLDAINSGNVGQPNVEVSINIENKTGSAVKARQTTQSFDGKRMVKGIILELVNTDSDFKNSLNWGTR